MSGSMYDNPQDLQNQILDAHSRTSRCPNRSREEELLRARSDLKTVKTLNSYTSRGRNQSAPRDSRLIITMWRQTITLLTPFFVLTRQSLGTWKRPSQTRYSWSPDCARRAAQMPRSSPESSVQQHNCNNNQSDIPPSNTACILCMNYPRPMNVIVSMKPLCRWRAMLSH